jgi:hypothetical protein
MSILTVNYGYPYEIIVVGKFASGATAISPISKIIYFLCMRYGMGTTQCAAREVGRMIWCSKSDRSIK